MNITIIHYRPNGSDYCRGCHMGSSDSDFSIYTAESEDDAAASIANRLEEDSKSDREYCHWESYILLNGLEEYDEGYDCELQRSIFKKAEEIFNDRVKRDEEIARQKKAEEKERKIKEKIEAKKKAEENRYAKFLKMKEEYNE